MSSYVCVPLGRASSWQITLLLEKVQSPILQYKNNRFINTVLNGRAYAGINLRHTAGIVIIKYLQKAFFLPCSI